MQPSLTIDTIKFYMSAKFLLASFAYDYMRPCVVTIILFTRKIYPWHARMAGPIGYGILNMILTTFLSATASVTQNLIRKYYQKNDYVVTHVLPRETVYCI